MKRVIKIGAIILAIVVILLLCLYGCKNKEKELTPDQMVIVTPKVTDEPEETPEAKADDSEGTQKSPSEPNTEADSTETGANTSDGTTDQESTDAQTTSAENEKSNAPETITTGSSSEMTDPKSADTQISETENKTGSAGEAENVTVTESGSEMQNTAASSEDDTVAAATGDAASTDKMSDNNKESETEAGKDTSVEDTRPDGSKNEKDASAEDAGLDRSKNDKDAANGTQTGAETGETPETLLKFGTMDVYLFMDENGLIRPDALLTKTELKYALEALLPADSSVHDIAVKEGKQAVTIEELRDALRVFYTEEELSILPDSEHITRAEFAAVMNQLLGRGNEPVAVATDAVRAADIQENSPYYTDLMEASVAHTVDENGKRWNEFTVPVMIRDFGSYAELRFKEPTEKGTVSTAYGECGEAFVVYTPYGYDPAKQYNVLVFLYGKDGDPYKILGENYGYEHYNTVWNQSFTTKAYFDFLIENGYCDPFIVVTTYTTLAINKVDRYERLLKYTVNHYSTYAKSSSTQDLIEARDHFAMAALSTGAQSVCVSIQRLPDIFGSFALFSGAMQLEDTRAALSRKGDISWLVMACGGWKDDMNAYTHRAFDMLSSVPNVKNASFVEVAGAGHDWGAFDAGLLELLSHFAPNTRDLFN